MGWYSFQCNFCEYMEVLIYQVFKKLYLMIINLCGEIFFCLFGGFCVIVDVVLFYVNMFLEVEEVFQVFVWVLIWINIMDSVFVFEVECINCIGVGMIGF